VNKLLKRSLMSKKLIDLAQLPALTKKLLESVPLVSTLVRVFHRAGGRVLLVGGATRDLLLGIPVKDLDVEVHYLTTDQVELILQQGGPVDIVGKSFGVFKIHDLEVDWSLPRADSVGRKPQVIVNPHMGLKEAFGRRDLTMNAMGIDLITLELVDPLGGLEDLRLGVLRAANVQRFVEDPLRFYRVMQCIARFNMQPDAQLNKICRTMQVGDVSIERIEQEFKKMLLKSQRPSLGLRWLEGLGRLQELLPELGALVEVMQNPQWHPEKDVFEHTMQTVDAAALLKVEQEADRLPLLYAALCHDLGKATTTHQRVGKIVSYGHDQAGVPLTCTLLERITKNKELMREVALLVRYHMMPGQLVSGQVGAAAYKRLASKIQPFSLKLLAALALADKRGRNSKASEPLTNDFDDIKKFLVHAQQAAVLEEAEKPLLQGKDLLDKIVPGPKLGALLKKAYALQIDEGINDKEVLKQRLLKKR
jgi:tRNA nucleotidyltransferase (CCA-adding enzyme)